MHEEIVYKAERTPKTQFTVCRLPRKTLQFSFKYFSKLELFVFDVEREAKLTCEGLYSSMLSDQPHESLHSFFKETSTNFKQTSFDHSMQREERQLGCSKLSKVFFEQESVSAESTRQSNTLKINALYEVISRSVGFPFKFLETQEVYSP